MEQTSIVIVNRQAGLVTKTFSDPRYEAFGLVEREVRWLTKLLPFDRVPKLVNHSDEHIVMTYVGSRLSKKNLPEDWEIQVKHLAEGLKKHRCSHNDVKVDEMMVLDGKIHLIDFGWATEIGKPMPDTWPSNLCVQDNEETLTATCMEVAHQKDPLASIKSAWVRQKGHLCQGSNIRDEKAYHDIPGFEQYAELEVHRGMTHKRVDLIADNTQVQGRTVLDLGCAVGGVSQGLAHKGAVVFGVDHDPHAIRVAKETSQYFDLDANYIVMDLETLYKSWRDPDGLFFGLPQTFDVVVWFDQFMWAAKQQGRKQALQFLRWVSEHAEELWFSTAAGEDDGMAGGALDDWGQDPSKYIREALEQNTVYTNIVEHPAVDDGWFPRPIFQCTK